MLSYVISEEPGSDAKRVPTETLKQQVTTSSKLHQPQQTPEQQPPGQQADLYFQLRHYTTQQQMLSFTNLQPFSKTNVLSCKIHDICENFNCLS